MAKFSKIFSTGEKLVIHESNRPIPRNEKYSSFQYSFIIDICLSLSGQKMHNFDVMWIF